MTIDGFQETQNSNSGCLINEENGGNSRKSDYGNLSETRITMPEEFVVIDCENRSNSGEIPKVSEGNYEKKSWVINVKCKDEEIWKEERICRICHLNGEEAYKEKMDLMRLGCSCKGELSTAHSHCADAWFNLKGNRMCEICGETVKNVRGVRDETFMEEWVDNRVNANGETRDSSYQRSGEEEGCWHRQPFCNFLIACLVIAFVLPWFFRINMF